MNGRRFDEKRTAGYRREKGSMKMKQEQKKKKSALYIIGFFFLVFLLGGIIYGLPMMSDALTSTWILEYGTLQVTDEAETCYIVRDETIYTAEHAGEIQYYFDEGAMVRKGTAILNIVSGGPSTALGNGLVSFYFDGNESIFTPSAMEHLKKDEVSKLTEKTKDQKRETAEVGEAIYKLVNAGEWFLTYWTDEESFVRAKYEEGKRVSVELPVGTIKGSVYKAIDTGKEYQVILRFNRYYADLCKVRILEDVTVVTSDSEGLLVRNESLATKDGQVGVYVKTLNGTYEFMPVSVIDTDGEYSLLQAGSFYAETKKGKVKVETVNPYDEILNKPKSEK